MLFQLKKYITFVFDLMHIKYGKRKLKSDAWRELIMFVFTHQAHSSTSGITFIR